MLTFTKYILAMTDKKVMKAMTGKSIREMLADSLIVAGITFFSVWTGTLSLNEILITIKATGLAFFTQLAFEKGIKIYNRVR